MLWPSDYEASSGNRVKRVNGFTLIELLVVLAIMGLLLLVVPQVTAGLPRFRLQAASIALSDKLRQLRDEAIRTGRSTALLLDDVNLQYASTSNPEWRRFPEVVEAVRLLRDTSTRERTEAQLQFYPDGSSSGGTISLRHGSRIEEITVEWLTGRVKND